MCIMAMQSVNKAQFLNITFLLVLFTAVPAGSMFESVTVPYLSMYASL